MKRSEVSPVWGVLLLIALALHTRYKFQLGIPLDMLWACHIATFLIALSTFTRMYWLASIGLLFHIGMGIPAYLLDAIATWTTSLTSVLVHLLPGIAGLWLAKRHGYPATNFRRTVVFVLLCQLLAYLVTPPALNVNLVFAAWGPMAELFPNIWVYRVFNLALACSMLFPAHLLLKKLSYRCKERSDADKVGRARSHLRVAQMPDGPLYARPCRSAHRGDGDR